jgi:hypothetical protein
VFGAFEVDSFSQAPLRSTATAQVNATAEEVFAYISDNQNWVSWFDSIESVEGSTSVRTFAFAGGGSISEVIVSYDDPYTFAWAIQPGNPLGVTDHVALLSITENADQANTVLLQIAAFFEHESVEDILPVIDGAGALIHGAAVAEFGGAVQ